MPINPTNNRTFAIMVNIFTIPNPIAGTLILQIAATAVNNSIDRFTEELKKHVLGKICPLHPRQNQDITVSADKNSNVSMEITSCCCDKFSDSLLFVPKAPLQYRNVGVVRG